MQSTTYFLSSLDSTRFEPVRACRLIELLQFDTGKQAVRAIIDPAVIGQDFDRTEDIAEVVLVARHEGVTLEPLNQFPCFVAITVARPGYEALQTPIRSDDLTIIGRGELYRTQGDATRHRFGSQ